MLDAYIYSGIRTPFGRQAGVLAPVRPDDLLAEVIRHLVANSDFSPEQIEDVVIGCACQAGEDSRNIGRHAALLADLPPSIPGQTVNRLCSSGLAAVLDSARAITAGEGELYIAGGVESMSRAPFVVGKSESAFGREFRVFDSAIGARFPNPEIIRRYGGDTMPETADNVADDLGITREQCDRYAEASQVRYAAAKNSGFMRGEIVEVKVPTGRKTAPRVVAEDEHPRPGTTFESLSGLKAMFDQGVTTAGNSSGINDGAVAMFVGTRAIGQEVGQMPVARILSGAAIGVAPRIMGVGPAYAIPKALERAGLTLDDVDVIEINEAFAAQVLACLKLMKLPFDDSRVNPNGGAIAVGHPLGASGARLVLTSVRELERRQARYAVVSLCIGVGQGLAVVIERI